MRRIIIAAGAVSALVLTLMMRPATFFEESDAGYAYTPVAQKSEAPQAIGDNEPISRAMVARMLALVFFSSEEIRELPRVHAFRDVSSTGWYEPYVNAVYHRSIMRGTGREFMPHEPLTLGQAQTLIRVLNPGSRISPAAHGENSISDSAADSISYALWVELYKMLLENLSGEQSVYETFGISVRDIVVLNSRNEGRLMSDQGSFGHAGLNMAGYADKTLRVLTRDDEIIALIALLGEESRLKSIYVIDSDEEGMTILSAGAEKFYLSAIRLEPGIADITVRAGRVIAGQNLSETVTGRVLRVSDSLVEVEGYGSFPVAAGFKVYDATGIFPRARGLNHIIIGTAARIYLQEGTERLARAAVILTDTLPQEIRVVINCSDFEGLVHRNVVVTSAAPFWVQAGERRLDFGANVRLTISDITNSDLFGADRISVHSNEGRLQILSISRNWAGGTSPKYRGIIEIARESSLNQGGGFTIVNQLPLEEYLFAVVPSEMPSSYGLVPSMVQAVAARSYAVNQFRQNRFHAYGGNVDDSVISQVYNNIPENDISIQAVESTRGLVLRYNERVVSANFFSTSAGFTANSGEVWAGGTDGGTRINREAAGLFSAFPSLTPGYLRAGHLFTEEINPLLNLRDEAAASAFFRRTDIVAFDSNAPWFRWRVEMSAAEISRAINSALEERMTATPGMFKTFVVGEDGGEWQSRPVSGIGTLRDMQVVARGEGGNIMALRLKGDAADIIVATEFNIRSLLSPARAGEITIERHNGSTVQGTGILPSAFFTFDLHFDLEEGPLTGVVIYGGGHGHGAGMSQYGVVGMAKRGFSFDEILARFYPGAVVARLPQ